MRLEVLDGRGIVVAGLDGAEYKTRSQVWKWLIAVYAELRTRNLMRKGK